MGLECRLLNKNLTAAYLSETREYKIAKNLRGSPKAVHVRYSGSSSATKTELGAAADAEFSGADRETFTVTVPTTRANTPGSSYFTFSVIDGSGSQTAYYAWISKPEIFTVVCDTRANIPGSSYFTWTDAEASPTSYYGFFTKPEITEVTCVPKADITAADSFHFFVDDGVGGEDEFYVWFNVSGTDSDPTETGTAIEANVSGSTTDADVAGVVAPLINAKANVSASATAEVVTITNANNGDVTDAASHEGGDPGFTYSIEQGGDDPSATGTGVEFDISGDASADDVGSTVATGINGLAGTTASNTTGTVTVTMASNGDPTDAADGDSGLTVTVTEQGGADPSATGTGVEVDVSASTSSADEADDVKGAITALSDVTATVSSSVVTVEMDNTGNVTDAADVDTGFTVSVTNQGNTVDVGSKIYFVSSSADDGDAAAKHARKVTAIGFRKNATTGRITLEQEEISLDGTTTVSSDYDDWIRVLHVYVSDWGSGGSDAAGNITMTDFDGTTTYLTITAGENESNGAVLWIPDSFNLLIPMVSADMTETAPTAGDGAIVFFDESAAGGDSLNTDPDHPTWTVRIDTSTPYVLRKHLFFTPLEGSVDGKVTMSEIQIANATDFFVDVIALYWD